MDNSPLKEMVHEARHGGNTLFSQGFPSSSFREVLPQLNPEVLCDLSGILPTSGPTVGGTKVRTYNLPWRHVML